MVRERPKEEKHPTQLRLQTVDEEAETPGSTRTATHLSRLSALTPPTTPPWPAELLQVALTHKTGRQTGDVRCVSMVDIINKWVGCTRIVTLRLFRRPQSPGRRLNTILFPSVSMASESGDTSAC